MTSEVMALREALTAIRRQLAKHDGCSRFGTADFAVLEDAKRAIDGAGLRVRNVHTCLLGSAVDIHLPAAPIRGYTVMAVYTVDTEAGQEFRLMVRTPSGGLVAGVELGQVVACPGDDQEERRVG